MVARAYLIATKDSTDTSIRVATEEYITGAVPQHDGRFAPSTAQFAERCRMHDTIAEAAIRRIRQKPEALLQLSPAKQAEMRERMGAMHVALPNFPNEQEHEHG